MRLTDLRIPARLHLLATLLLALLAIGLITAQWRLQAASTDAATAQARLADLAEAGDDARAAQVRFKVQIQEWKNTLLRGGKPESFDKYSKAFRKEGEEVQAHLRSLRKHSEALKLPTQDVDQAMAGLQELTSTYLTALKGYDTAHADDSAHAVDAAVKGKDRAPTQAIDAIVARLHKTLERSEEHTSELQSH